MRNGLVLCVTDATYIPLSQYCHLHVEVRYPVSWEELPLHLELDLAVGVVLFFDKDTSEDDLIEAWTTLRQRDLPVVVYADAEDVVPAMPNGENIERACSFLASLVLLLSLSRKKVASVLG